MYIVHWVRVIVTMVTVRKQYKQAVYNVCRFIRLYFTLDNLII